VDRGKIGRASWAACGKEEKGRGRERPWAGPCREGKEKEGREKKRGRWAGPREKERERKKGKLANSNAFEL
jgi:hypothetical protein